MRVSTSPPAAEATLLPYSKARKCGRKKKLRRRGQRLARGQRHHVHAVDDALHQAGQHVARADFVNHRAGLRVGERDACSASTAPATRAVARADPPPRMHRRTTSPVTLATHRRAARPSRNRTGMPGIRRPPAPSAANETRRSPAAGARAWRRAPCTARTPASTAVDVAGDRELRRRVVVGHHHRAARFAQAPFHRPPRRAR